MRVIDLDALVRITMVVYDRACSYLRGGGFSRGCNRKGKLFSFTGLRETEFLRNRRCFPIRWNFESQYSCNVWSCRCNFHGHWMCAAWLEQ